MASKEKKSGFSARVAAAQRVASEMPQKIELIPISIIDPDPDQPRMTFHQMDGVVAADAQASLENLARDIREQGVLEPITVRETSGGRYMIIFGERRWRASIMAEKAEIITIVRNDLSLFQIRAAQLSENVQREDPSDLDIARFVRKMLQDFPEMQRKDLAQVFNARESQITRYLAMLDDSWSDYIKEGLIVEASVLELFRHRRLTEESRLALVREARKNKKRITAPAIRAALDQDRQSRVSVSPSAPPRDPATMLSGLNVILAGSQAGDTYKRAPVEVFDVTGLSGSVGANATAAENFDVRMTLSELLHLIKVASKAGVSIDNNTVSIRLSDSDVRALLQKMGRRIPERFMQYPMALLEALTAG